MVGLISRGYSSAFKGRGIILNNPPSHALGLIAAEIAGSEQAPSAVSSRCANMICDRIASGPAFSPSLVRLSDAERLLLAGPGQTVMQYQDALVRAMARRAADAVGVDPQALIANANQRLERQPYVDITQAVLDSVSSILGSRALN